MSFTGSVIWEVQTGGNDSNGGGFDHGASGFPTDGAATAANTVSPVFTSASYNFVAGDVGAVLFIKSGTNSNPGRFPIISVASNAATLGAAVGQYQSYLGANTLIVSTVVGCATVASPTSLTWGIDYSQQAGAQIAFTDMVIDATTNTKFTSVAHPVGKNFIGNIIRVTSGTGFTVQRVVINSTLGTVATCDKSLGTLSSTGGNGNLGGAFLSPSVAFSLGTQSHFFFIKSGTYLITSNSTSTAGGALGAIGGYAVMGYSTNRYFGNTDTPPLIQISGSTITMFQGSGIFYNITFDGNNQTLSQFSTVSGSLYICCTIKNFNTATAGVSVFIGCLYTGNSVGMSYTAVVYCEAYGNTATPFPGGGFRCLSYANTGASTDGFIGNCYECTSVANGRNGFFGTGIFVNCHAQSNVSFGWSSSGTNSKIMNCTGVLNTAGLYDASISNFFFGLRAVSADVFINVSGNNYALNNIAGAGAALRAAGRFAALSTYPRGITTSYSDIGAVQHSDTIAIVNKITNQFLVSEGDI